MLVTDYITRAKMLAIISPLTADHFNNLTLKPAKLMTATTIFMTVTAHHRNICHLVYALLM